MLEMRVPLFRLVSLVIPCALASFGQDSFHAQLHDLARGIESSENGHLAKHGFVLMGTVWPTTQIPVCWESASDEFRQEKKLVQLLIADTWARASKLRFTGWEPCSPRNRGIRIKVDDTDPSNGPHTKGLGRQLDGIPDGMVLNFSFDQWSPECKKMRDYCIKGIALHEFGHAIGLAHEHNRPDTPGECKEAPQGPSGDRVLTPWDKNSVMNYCNLKFNNGAELSKLDIDTVRRIYGAPSPAGNAAPDLSIRRQVNGLADLIDSSANGHLAKHGYVLIGVLWPTTQIPVCWEPSTSEYLQEKKIVQQQIADTWMRNSALNFTGWETCAPRNAGIRIHIDDSHPKNGPHTKGLGKQLNGVKNGMVLNFTFNNWSPGCKAMRDYCIKGIAVHEFGHAIGFAHEQNRPDTPGECNQSPQGTNGDKMLTPWDRESVMNYCNAKYNNDAQLSKLDADAVRRLYGTSESMKPR